MSRRPALALLALPLLLALAGCGGGGPSGGTGDTQDPPVADPVPADGGDETLDVPDDAELVVQAQAVASNGATLDLVLVVRKSTAWDDPAAADRPAAFTDGCAGGYDATIYAEQLFSFAAIDVTATPEPGTPAWPADEAVTVLPDTSFLSLASTGALAEAPTDDFETPHCRRDRILTGAGAGTLIVGFRGDTDAAGAAGGFTRWANHPYGFQTPSGAGATLTGCSLTVLPLGTEFGWPASAPETEQADLCRYGIVDGQDSDS